MAKRKPEYIEIDNGNIVEVISKEITYREIQPGDIVNVRWNESTILTKRVIRVASESEYIRSLQGGN
jgi:hypothetical protein